MGWINVQILLVAVTLVSVVNPLVALVMKDVTSFEKEAWQMLFVILILLLMLVLSRFVHVAGVKRQL
jgi:hypothetical protein